MSDGNLNKSYKPAKLHRLTPSVSSISSASSTLRPSAQRTLSSDSLQSTTPSGAWTVNSELPPSPYNKAESVLNLDAIYKNNTQFATRTVLPPSDYNSPYYIPFNNNTDPRPVDQLIYRFSIWKMIIKQIVFYFKEMCVFKSQTCEGNRAMLENLEILRRQNSGKLKFKASANKNLKKSMSSTGVNEEFNNNPLTMHSGSSTSDLGIMHGPGEPMENELNIAEQNIVNRLLQTTFLPPTDHSILSISSTFFNNHSCLREKELLTYQQLSNRLIPRLENLKDQLNETIKQMNSIKNSSDYKTKNLKMEIAKTGGVLSDYITSIELLKTGHSKSSLGTTINLTDNKIDSKLDPYILKLKLDLQLKDQLYIEAHLKEMYYDLQYKAVQLEKILYTEIQTCISTYTDLIDAELNSVRNNLIAPFQQNFIKNDPSIDWDYFIKNDNKKNFLPVNAKNTLAKVKSVRKNSDIVYPYRNNVMSSCIYAGYLERKSKYLKNYSKFYYVLTINFLHEFKTDDRIKELSPLQSFPLSDLTIATVDSDPKKFVIRIYKSDSKDVSKAKYTFKCDNLDSSIKWIDYLSDLTSISNIIERNTYYDINVSNESNDDSSIRTSNSSIKGVNRGYQDDFRSADQNLRSGSKVTSKVSTGVSASSPQLENQSKLNYSKSSGDDLYKSQYYQIQNSLQQQTHSPKDDYFFSNPINSNNVSAIPFKSVKSQPALNMRQSSSTSLGMANSKNSSRTSSRSSSRSSSRASSPPRIRNANPNTSSNPNLAAASNSNPNIRASALMSPKLVSSSSATTTPTGSNFGNSGGDYFSYTPRKVQASIIRNGSRLASNSSLATARLTPNSNSSSGLTINVNMNKEMSNLPTQLSTSNSQSLPKINILESSPITPKNSILVKPEDKEDEQNDQNAQNIQNDQNIQSDWNTQSDWNAQNNWNAQNDWNAPNEQDSAALQKRRQTLSEKLDMTGLINANSATTASSSSDSNTPAALLKLPKNTDPLNQFQGLIQTPGVIPGSRMNQIFDTSNTYQIDEEHENFDG